ncbi:MAG: NAD(P)/FAD-dependent oxidoreductase [Anaerolineae bacterium]|nr:NAD(P)/FAD-dependent oxidoreductase [Anaerolineae bacterium]NUQ04327.1 FAD-dependent oxidoreductase [Anaerolineae bacterium]
MSAASRIVIVGAGIGGLTTAALLAQAGCNVTVLESQTYAGGSAGTFLHKGYRFDAGATVAGGFQPGGPHALVAERLGLNWDVHQHDPAWVVHLPDRSIRLCQDNADIERNFPASSRFWRTQSRLAALGWSLSAQGLPWIPTSPAEAAHFAGVGLRNLPGDLELIPYALMSAYRWLSLSGLSSDPAFVRFINAQLLISAQTTSRSANAMYSATALDLARQGVYHVRGGMGGIAETLVKRIRELGGEVLFRQKVVRISTREGRVISVTTKRGDEFPCDFLVANITPWSLDNLLGEDSPPGLRREAQTRRAGWGAFVLHLGVRNDKLPKDLPDHHQVIESYDGALGETRSIFLSMSPRWDASRAPDGYRAVTVTTHTEVQPWWDLLANDPHAYGARKDSYAERILTNIERAMPGFRTSIALMLPGTPVTYEFYTGRQLGMVGGFPQSSLFRARTPLTGLANARLVGDSIFPGQSTAGVTLGAIRVARDVLRRVETDEPQVGSAVLARDSHSDEALL